MINVIPEWLQEAIDFLNEEFPDDRDATITILYGYGGVGTSANNETGFAVYHTDAHSIYLADPYEIRNSCNLSLVEAMEATIKCLFHEYRHHQQNVYRLEMDEEDAERFAEQMKCKFMG